MVRPRSQSPSAGFSLVEMMVAVAFVLILMAGMASVFKASLSTFFTSGETVSAGRRTRMSVDLLRDDIDMAAMYLTSLTSTPSTNPAQPPIYIQPNMPIMQANGTTTPAFPADPLDPTVADQLAFLVDMPLPFQGKLATGATTPRSATDLVNLGLAPAPTDFTYFIDCGTVAYAKMVASGQDFIFKDNYEVGYIGPAPTIAGTVVTVVEGLSPTAGLTSQSTGSMLPSKFDHISGTGILFVVPAQLVLYQVKMLLLDMDLTKPNGIPCLVRDQYNYSDVVAGGFAGSVPTAPEQIIAENVQNLKFYMSCNAGATWAGSELPVATTGMAGWTAIRTDLDTQLAAVGRNGYTTTENTEQWFRSIPTLVRCDITTRTAAKRTEYNTAANAATVPALAYKNVTQSLVFVPRHSGLPLD